MEHSNWLHTVRWKFLGAMLGSGAVTFIFLYFSYTLATNTIKSKTPIVNPIRWMVNNWGSDAVLIVVGISMFAALYYWMSRPIIRDLKQIEHSMQEIAAGRFTSDLRLTTKDELGAIASQMHLAADEWNSYLSEIKHGLEQIAAGHFDYSISVKADHELGSVADSINRMSAQLQQSIMEERLSEKTKNDLITGVSHDLRTPLTSILGFLELIEQDRYHDEVELRYYVNIAYVKANSLKKLIDDLFEYTRINNELPLDCREMDLIGFILQLVEEFVPSMESQEMQCEVKTAYSSLLVNADGNQLVRAFENLLSNAIRYGKAGKRVDIELAAEQEEAVVRIVNYGKPIPERDLPFLFDRFYRVDSSRSTESGGTGLGLAITKSIVELHNGQINVQSTAKQTVFETRLPLLRQVLNNF